MDGLADFFNSCPELLFITAEDSAILRLSASLERVVGPEAQRGTRIADRVHPDDRQAFDAAWARLSDKSAAVEGPSPFTFRLREGGGAYRLVSCSARRSAASGEIHGSLRDGGVEQRLAELAWLAEILRAIESSIPISVWAVEQDGTFIHHAGKGVEAIGVKQGQFLGLNIFQIYAGGDGIELVHAALKGEVGHHIAKMHETYWDTWYIPVRDAAGEVRRVVGLTLDISAVTRAEQALREKMELIERQRQVIRALGTPIIEVWDRVLTLPMVGVVDSERASEVMDKVLARVSEKRAGFAIIDLTGVDVIDTGTAAHLLKLIQALRLLGAEGIIVGIQPAVARTMIQLGIDLSSIVTRANLQDGLQHCLQQMRREAR